MKAAFFRVLDVTVLPHIGDNEEMIAVTEPQVWTIIGVMVAALAAILTIVTQSFNRTMSARFEAVSTKLDAKFEAMDARLDGLRTEMVLRFEQVDDRFAQVDERFAQVDRRLERLETRVGDLDRDMQSVVKRVFPPE